MSVDPICFMIMPYRTKAVADRHDPAIPEKIDFDRLWEAAFMPAIAALGYQPVRADQDLGALIINEMIERLAISDLVIADVTIANANVYYEIGLRHAAKRQGCVMIAADWAKPVFDINQMRQVRYKLTTGVVDDAAAADIKATLATMIPPLAAGTSPFYQALPGFPDDFDEQRASAFKNTLLQLSTFQGEVAAVRAAPRDERLARALALRDTYASGQTIKRPVAFELLYLLRDFAPPNVTLAFIDSLPGDLQTFPLVLEQKALVQSQAKQDLAAIATLEALIKLDGETAERRGLVGGRYKRLYGAAANLLDREEYLDLAIKNYDLGMHLDLNDYYPASNLPRLYQLRNQKGDADRARVAAAVTLIGCQRAITRNPTDEWIKPTLLAAAFDAGDVDAARDLAADVRSQGAATWKLQSVIGDVELALQLQDPEHQSGLRPILHRLQALVEAR